MLLIHLGLPAPHMITAYLEMSHLELPPHPLGCPEGVGLKSGDF